MQHSDQISGLFFLGFGLFVIFYSLKTLPIGTLYEPQAGFYPLLSGILMVGFALILSVQAMHEKVEKRPQFGSRWKRVLFSSAEVLLYVLLLEFGGFLLCTFLFVLCYLKGIEWVAWAGSLVFAASSVLVTYFSFSHLLGVSLPQGIIPF